MCGLTGAAGNLNVKSDKMFRILLKLDALRGEDSTGAAFINKNGDTKIVKAVGHPYELMDKQQFGNNINKMNRAIIGHNRFATQGVVNLVNSHPFEYGNIIGAHNGTVHNKHDLIDGHKFTVDSQAIYNSINEIGVKATIDKLRGAWALTWWDNAEETMNFLRNKERPLYVAFQKNGEIVYWASEEWMLKIASSRAEVELEHIGLLDADSHLSFKIDNKGVISEWQESEVKSNAAPFTQGNYQQRNGNNYSQPSTNTVVSQQQQHSRYNVIPLPRKIEETPQKKVVGGDGYSGSKNIRVLGIALGVDNHGAKYVQVKDMKHNDKQIRLYVNKPAEADKYINNWFTVDIGKKFYNQNEGYYYKVEFNSVTNILAQEEPEVTTVNRYCDQGGTLIVEAAWKKKYGTCTWCDTNIEPTEDYLMSREGSILCQDCMKDESISCYLRS